MALYRKYRPASFAEVVGQDQVTRPLSVALDTGHINHAYLFSGPRGCGKTSSARILARSLNCVEGPTSTPCGKCPSCVSLAPGGSGNLDVTELDAASHNGVEDMRALRDRAYYAPAESRYRVFIIDEAHMISSAGANALLKIVEEPPEHTIFIFATTEPEKVIGTIRSRVHHYPFRLLTPQSMRQLLHHIVKEEQVQVEESVYSLVINAGGGSPRDSLSILDQLLAGAGPEGLTYEMALPLLGVTDLSLIDDSISALAANDAAAAFQLIDRVIEAGHDPRRYVQDLLDRLRDLMILQVVPDAFEQGLVDAPPARQEVLRKEATLFPQGRLAELADRVNERITDLRGATAPRLLLEILMAHLIVVPSAVGVGPSARVQMAAQAVVPQERVEAASTPSVEPSAQATQPSSQTLGSGHEAAEREQSSPTAPIPQSLPGRQASPIPQASPQPSSPQQESQRAEQDGKPETQSASLPENQDQLAQLQREWGAIRGRISEMDNLVSVMVGQAQVVALEGNTMIISHATGALARRLNEETKLKVVRAAIAEVIGKELDVRFVVGKYAPEGQGSADSPEVSEGSFSRAAAASSRGAGEQLSQPGWQRRADEGKRHLAERANAPEFSDGVPIPPEPDPDFGEGLEHPQEVSARSTDSTVVAESPQTEPPEQETGAPTSAATPLDASAVQNQTAGQEDSVPEESLTPQESLESAVNLVQKELGARLV